MELGGTQIHLIPPIDKHQLQSSIGTNCWLLEKLILPFIIIPLVNVPNADSQRQYTQHGHVMEFMYPNQDAIILLI